MPSEVSPTTIPLSAKTDVPTKEDAATVATTVVAFGRPSWRTRPATYPTRTRASAQRAVIDPFVDFGALDLVGVVVPAGTHSDRAVIEADGSLG